MQDKLENLISANTLEEAHNNGAGDVASAVRYMIPVPIKVVVPVPVAQQENYPYPYPNEELEPIVAVPVGRRPTRYGSALVPVGPPFLAVPAGSQQQYPPPARYGTYARQQSYPQRFRAAEAVRRTRSVDEEDFRGGEDQKELTWDSSRDEPVQRIRGMDNPLKASSKKSSKSYKSTGKRNRSKRQVGGYYTNHYMRGGYARPTRVVVPPQGQVIVAPVPVPETQYVPVPVYVPVPAESPQY